MHPAHKSWRGREAGEAGEAGEKRDTDRPRDGEFPRVRPRRSIDRGSRIADRAAARVLW